MLLPSVCDGGIQPMRTTILACLIAFAGLLIIAGGVWDLSNLEPETGETLE